MTVQALSTDHVNYAIDFAELRCHGSRPNQAGRSTTVSISLGIALVAGRNRVPRPVTGRSCRC